MRGFEPTGILEKFFILVSPWSSSTTDEELYYSCDAVQIKYEEYHKITRPKNVSFFQEKWLDVIKFYWISTYLH